MADISRLCNVFGGQQHLGSRRAEQKGASRRRYAGAEATGSSRRLVVREAESVSHDVTRLVLAPETWPESPADEAFGRKSEGASNNRNPLHLDGMEGGREAVQ